VISVGLFHVLWVYAVDQIGVAPAHVFNYTAPAFVVLFSWLLWREPITRGMLAALLLTFVGCVFVARAYDWSQFQLNWKGTLVGLATGITWATYSIFSKISLQRHSPWTLITYAFGLSALVILLAQPARALSFPWSQPRHVWIWLWLLALVPTVTGFCLYTWALRYLSASGAIITATTETVLAALLAYLLFGEVLAPLQILGAALIVLGLVSISKESSSKNNKLRI
jgi:drug/metabolite transporter (DMT)-like permease